MMTLNSLRFYSSKATVGKMQRVFFQIRPPISGNISILLLLLLLLTNILTG